MASASKRLVELSNISEDPDLWQNPEQAQNILKEKRTLETKLSSFNQLKSNLTECLELEELALLENDPQVLEQNQQELKKLAIIAEKFEVECLFSGEFDSNNCFMEINAGAGGTESHDWASIMMRMYLRFAERLGFKPEIIHLINGEEAGIKSCTIKINGYQAHGWFRTESGVHRLVSFPSPESGSQKRLFGCWN